jgi:glutaconyl-CoA decarboxylase
MRFIARSKDRTHHVIAEPAASGWRVELDGRSLSVDVLPLGASLYSLLLDGRSYEVDVLESDGAFMVLVNGQPFRVELADEGASCGGAAAPAGLEAPGGAIRAPMPGKVVQVLVRPGDVVQPRDAIVVLEAMKMENELHAPLGGRVVDVRAAEGQSVNAGDVLVVIEGAAGP